MTVHVVAAMALLALPAVLPSLAVLGTRPLTVFMIPLVGAVFSAVSAEIESALGLTLMNWYLVVTVIANLMSVGWFVRARSARRNATSQGGEGGPGRAETRWNWWSVVTLVVMALAVLWPLQALRVPVIAYDGYAIWTLHSLFVYGGHAVLQSDLTNPAYHFSNPNYPLLIPATGALGFVAEGGTDLRLASIITAVLNGCALAVAGCAIASIVGPSRPVRARVVALVAGACVCLIGFGLGGPYAVGGYADVLWSASAVGAVLIGLILPPSGRNVLAAWLAATVAALTKNEGLIAALMIFALLAVRHTPWPTRSRSSPEAAPRYGPLRSGWSAWGVRVVFVTVVMSAPSLVWPLYVNYEGIKSDFVGVSGQSLSLRLHATTTAAWENMHLVPVAMMVALIGGLVLTGTRRKMSIGSDVWMWTVLAGSLIALFVTYVFGALEIHWWLRTSVNRTTIFENLALYSDVAVWLAVAAAARPEELRFRSPGWVAGHAGRHRETKLMTEHSA